MGLFDKLFGGLGKTRERIDLEELFQDYAPDRSCLRFILLFQP